MKLNFRNIILFFILVGGIAFTFIKFSKNSNNNSGLLVPNNGETSTTTDIVEDAVPPEIKKVDDTTNTFIHKQYGFSFNYPAEMKTSNFREGDGEQILFQGDKKGEWFQIYITAWDETDDISVARIKKDMPSLVISDPQKVILGPGQKDGIGPHALIFFSKDAGLGETREIWFVYGGNLYQVTTYKRLDTMIGNVLSTITFK